MEIFQMDRWRRSLHSCAIGIAVSIADRLNTSLWLPVSHIAILN